jgi:hypothetical protein
MFQQILKLLPHDPGNITLAISAVGTIAGLVLWLIGERIGRVVLTLLAVAMGTAIGMKIPQWFQWSIDPMATGTGLALVLGLGAYTLHRFWLGAWLGALLTMWAALGAWVVLGHNNWHYPTFHQSQPITKYCYDIWNSFPSDMQRWLPYLAAISMIVAMATAVLWPRFGSRLFWSATGTSLMFCMGSILLSHYRPAVLQRLPRQFWSQLAALGGAVALGMLVQWQLGPKSKKKKKATADEPEPEPAHSH